MFYACVNGRCVPLFPLTPSVTVLDQRTDPSSIVNNNATLLGPFSNVVRNILALLPLIELATVLQKTEFPLFTWSHSH